MKGTRRWSGHGAGGRSGRRIGRFAIGFAAVGLVLGAAVGLVLGAAAGVRVYSEPPPKNADTPEFFQVEREAPAKLSAVAVIELLPALVARVVDGDTVKVAIADGTRLSGGIERQETIRLLGVDAPELPWGGKESEPYAEASRAFVVAALEGRRVYLARDWDLRDRYGRLLAYIYLDDGTCFNLKLVADGQTGALLTYRFAFMKEFAAAEAAARSAGKGLWEKK